MMRRPAASVEAGPILYFFKISYTESRNPAARRLPTVGDCEWIFDVCKNGIPAVRLISNRLI